MAFIMYTGLWNQGFARVYVIATAVGILLWSVALLRSAWASSGVAAFGLLVSAGVLLGFLSGRVGLDVHGFGLIMFSEAAWLVWIGVALCRGSNYPRE